MRRFVLLHHECPTGVPRATHWDLMLEEAGMLRTWVLHEPPSVWNHRPIVVEEIQRHRIDYLDLEGPLSKGRGSITRVDRGTLEPHEVNDTRICLYVFGRTLSGVLTLTRSNSKTSKWQLSFAADDETTG